MTVIRPNSISGVTSITAHTQSIEFYKSDGSLSGANLDGVNINTAGILTASNFKTGTSNVHNAGIEVAGINVLGADTPIGVGATIFNSGGAIFAGTSGVVTATAFHGNGANLTGLNSDLVNDTSPQLGGNLDCNNKNISLNDSTGDTNNRIKIGTHDDLHLWHNSSTGNSNISNYNGNLYLQGNNGSGTGVNQIAIMSNAAVELNYQGNKKLETTNTGTKVTGNLQFASAGQGIDFSASTHASGKQSELLDDYERGSWTPQFFNARTGGTQLSNPSNTQANYVKVGRIVYLHLGVHGLTKNWAGSNTQIFIRGLPYRSYFQHNGHCIRCGYFGPTGVTYSTFANLRQYDTYMELQKSGGAQGRYEALYWSDIHWEGYGNITCEMVYETDQGV
tara:strand:+ start:177 stop:1352 length:1176 start_codon:yes stop_codon:yes gene_type:complete